MGGVRVPRGSDPSPPGEGRGNGAALTVHVQSLDDNFQLYFVGHVAQGAHGCAQLLLGDEAIAIAVKDFEGLSDFCGGSRAGGDFTFVV